MTGNARGIGLAAALAVSLASPLMAATVTVDPGQMEEALDISRTLLSAPSASGGASDTGDAAFGAFQRGYYLTALDLALPRAETGDAAAQTLVAEIYANGLGVAENLPLAVQWYERAHNGGDLQASFRLATIYQEGRGGIVRDRARAAALFAAAAEGGHIAARYNLGLLHIEGRFVEPNIVRAATLIAEAAEAGYPEAQYDFAVMLLEGAGTAPDPVRAATYMQAAAEQGLIDAQVEWATMLYLGEGTGRDVEAAARWYATASGAGNPVAQARYARLLVAGEGVSIDLESAAMWRALARRQGLRDDVLDRMLAAVPAPDIARGEERARFWPQEPPGDTPRDQQLFIIDPTGDPLPPVRIPVDAPAPQAPDAALEDSSATPEIPPAPDPEQ